MRTLASARSLFPMFASRARPSVRVRGYASKPPNRMGEWYSNILPAMFPISLLASAVYTGLLLAQLTLSHEKTMGEQSVRLQELEAEVDALHRARQS